MQLDEGVQPRSISKSSNALIAQSNQLINAAYHLRLNERRLLLICQSLLDSRLPAVSPESRTVAVRAAYVAEVCGISNKEARTLIERGIEHLWQQSFFVSRERNGKTYEVEKRWCDERSTEWVDGAITVRLHEDVIRFLTMLSGNFTTYRLRQVVNLESFFSIRLYELCAQVVTRQNPVREIAVDDFRHMMMLTDKYDKVFDLQRYVVLPAVEEVNANCDIEVDFSLKRAGRKVTHFVFRVARKEGAEARERESLELEREMA